MSHSPRLPPELWDYIIDCLSGDRLAIRQCALACRDWLPRAQHHIHGSFYIDWSNCQAFSRLLDSNLALAAHVRKLEIEGAFGIFSMDRVHANTLDRWLRTLPALTTHLTNLSTLELALLTIDADLVHNVFARLPGVTHLTLWACALTSFDVFVDLFAAYPRLSHLNVAFTQEWDAPTSTSTSSGSPRTRRAPTRPLLLPDHAPTLTTVELKSSSDNFRVLRWLVTQRLHLGIHTLSCTRVAWPSLPLLADVLAALAPTLRTLRIGFGDSRCAADDADEDDLVPAPAGPAPPTDGGNANPVPVPVPTPARPRRATHPVFRTLPVLTALTLDVHTNRLAAVPYTLFLLAHLPAPALTTLTFAVRCPGVHYYHHHHPNNSGSSAAADAHTSTNTSTSTSTSPDTSPESPIGTGPPVPWSRLAETTARLARGSAPHLRRVVVSADADAAGDAELAFPPRGLAAVDFVAMEREARAAFAAQGLRELVSFVRWE